MKPVSFSQLQIFTSIVTEGSISGAARKLEIAPASVSQSLKKLELQLGLPLFTRSTRKVQLTEAGQLLFDRTESAMTDIEFALESVGDLSANPSGTVRLTTPRFAYQYLIQPYYAEFCQLYPEITLDVSVSDEAVNIISEGFDLGIRFGDRVEQGMVARQLTPVMKEALFASKEYVKRYGTPKVIAQLKSHKLVQYRFIASNQLAPLILKDGQTEVSVDMPLAMVCNDTDLMIDAATKGLGIGRIVEPMVTEQLAQKQLIPILEPYWRPYPGLYLYFSQNSQKAKRVRVFIDFLLEKMHASQLR